MIKRQRIHTITILLLLHMVFKVNSTCYDYWKGDVLPAFTSDSYCSTFDFIQEISLLGQSQHKSSAPMLQETQQPLLFMSRYFRVSIVQVR